MTDLDEIIAEKARQMLKEKKTPKDTDVQAVADATVQPQPVPTTKSYDEQASDFVDAVSARKAVEDETLVDSVAQSKKKGIIHRANATLKKEEAESKNADTILQEANFNAYSGVAALAGIKKPLPQKMQVVLFTILSAVQLIIFILVGVPISVFNIVCDSVDTSFTKLASLTKAARKLVVALLGIGAVALVVFVVRFYLLRFGILS